MQTITINAATLQRLDAHSISGRTVGARKLPDGRYQIDLEDDVVAAMQRIDPDPDRAIGIATGSISIGHA
jgi:hypothetical protein